MVDFSCCVELYRVVYNKGEKTLCTFKSSMTLKISNRLHNGYELIGVIHRTLGRYRFVDICAVDGSDSGSDKQLFNINRYRYYIRFT